jgi:MFS family permease
VRRAAITPFLPGCPTYLKVERKLSVVGSGGYIGVVIAGSFLGLLFGAYLADRIGRRANFILYAACSLVAVFVYTQLHINDTLMLILGFPLGFFANGIFAGMGAFLTENYPTRVRGSGQGFAYNFGRGMAALNPTLVGLLSATVPLGRSIGIFAAIAYGLVIFAALMLPETKGHELTPEK